jgi:hypothetical protein
MSDSSASSPFDPKFPGFAGFGPMMEQMESFKRLWSSMDGSSRLVPTLDVEELDKRIADLKAVEQWLNLNLSMLRGSIQGLEIQRGTLAAVKAFGAAFQSPAGWPGAPFGPASPPEQAAQHARPSAAGAAPTAPSGSSDSSATQAASPTPSPSNAMPGIDPSAWWALLQNNFQQIAQAALAGTASATSPQRAAGTTAADRSSGGKTRRAAPRKTATKPSPGGAASRPAARKAGSGR